MIVLSTEITITLTAKITTTDYYLITTYINTHVGNLTNYYDIITITVNYLAITVILHWLGCNDAASWLNEVKT